MQSSDSDILTYQACCGLDGRIYHVDTVRRNGRAVPILRTALATCSSKTGPADEDVKARKLFRLLSSDLTPTERRTWRKLLVEGKSIVQVASEEAVSRAAIYERIRGNSKGHGGMIAKNEFVYLWWLRRRLEEDEDIY